jgi:hypothetical protein
MLFDLSSFRTPLPDGVRVYASGANRLAEIRGFASIGMPVGVSVDRLNDEAIAALLELQQPVMADSGAFSEIAFTEHGCRIVSPITGAEWRRRLAIYLRLAISLREKAIVVAPDRVGDQQETLRRLALYRHELAVVAKHGASILLPLQVGAMSHSEFYEAALLVVGLPLTPAMPMRKAATGTGDLMSFMEQYKPTHLHLLGIGAQNRRAATLIRAIRHFSPGTRISMDSNRLRAVVGKGRALTRCEAELRSSEPECVYGVVESPTLAACGIALDYTDLIASPALWADGRALSVIAEEVGLSPTQTAAFVNGPDEFLQAPFDNCACGNWDMRWIEHPRMSAALDCGWERHVEQTVRSAVRTAAIIRVFSDEGVGREERPGADV